MATKKIITSFEMLNEVHKQEMKDFQAAVFQQWQPIAEREAEINALYGKIENAPMDVQKAAAKSREEFREEWGSDGRLINSILEEQQAERLEFSQSLKRTRVDRTKAEDRER